MNSGLPPTNLDLPVIARSVPFSQPSLEYSLSSELPVQCDLSSLGFVDHFHCCYLLSTSCVPEAGPGVSCLGHSSCPHGELDGGLQSSVPQGCDGGWALGWGPCSPGSKPPSLATLRI